LPKAPDGGGAFPNAPDDGGGAAPLTGGKGESFAVPALPGSGAGNAPCAETCPAWNVTRATTASTADLKSLRHQRRVLFRDFRSISGTRIVNLLVPMTFRSSQEGVAEATCELRKVGTNGAINRRIIKAVPSGLQASSRQENDSVSVFYDCCQRLTTRGIGQDRGAKSP
jgi:hypothetical protein